LYPEFEAGAAVNAPFATVVKVQGGSLDEAQRNPG